MPESKRYQAERSDSTAIHTHLIWVVLCSRYAYRSFEEHSGCNVTLILVVFFSSFFLITSRFI